MTTPNKSIIVPIRADMRDAKLIPTRIAARAAHLTRIMHQA